MLVATRSSAWRYAILWSALWLLVGAAMILSGCMEPGNDTTLAGLNDPACAKTREGSACLTLRFRATDSVKRKTSLAGSLEWSIYHDGDVDILGPGDHQSVAGGEIQGVSLAGDASPVELTLPNVAPGAYQALAFLDEDGNGESNSGEAVTLPRNGFDVPADEHVVVEVTLNWVR